MSIAKMVLHTLAPAIEALGEHGWIFQGNLIDDLNDQLLKGGFQLEYNLSPDGRVIVCEIQKKGDPHDPE